MAVPIEPGDDGGGGGPPGTPGYVPPASEDAALSLLVTSTNITITAGQIADAGGPWESYTVRVTAVNDAGASSPVEVST